MIPDEVGHIESENVLIQKDPHEEYAMLSVERIIERFEFTYVTRTNGWWMLSRPGVSIGIQDSAVTDGVREKFISTMEVCHPEKGLDKEARLAL